MHSTNFFISIGEPECQNKYVINTFSKNLHEKANTNFIFKAITEEEIGNIINSLCLRFSLVYTPYPISCLKKLRKALYYR